ncbi:thiamine diphosphokinase [Peribacillus saganii]|uniref:Thiamine diphosphokinase n=1 Tax=Peribacillus saganii TaxID=2303992 RepID=A0A372LBJ4_9BACI|nr:thiamine diphosphokinase [Peribacillus saganii]RFU63227.1 thiamine diphosphokinase [Peribacillus saganii]
MNICLVAGGPPELLPDLSLYQSPSTLWVGIDRGVFILLEKGIKPDVAFGDFDSVTGDELDLITAQLGELEIYPSEKDETDMEIAFNWTMSQKAENIFIFGATGGRLDHMLANIQLLTRDEVLLNSDDPEIHVVDRLNMITVRKPGTYHISRQTEFRYVSFLPVTREVKGITLNGFKYPLDNMDIKMGFSLCVSNELISNNGTFSFTDGILLVVRSRD